MTIDRLRAACRAMIASRAPRATVSIANKTVPLTRGSCVPKNGLLGPPVRGMRDRKAIERFSFHQATNESIVAWQMDMAWQDGGEGVDGAQRRGYN
eukprot:CAMPEP_0174715850 /NCGR_PEP_ID=MMETSP1094-20130205/22647_1 /TAXON_ID=156173 /ORGANISM="Chrysochromulina brevifilum, Strain UTEX LB 985" /LENGTH=95 /DNA_ID=CAMNT_0015915509 /DNA_START=27 /DNA_END=314 /DNA_ORIENTATION=+